MLTAPGVRVNLKRFFAPACASAALGLFLSGCHDPNSSQGNPPTAQQIPPAAGPLTTTPTTAAPAKVVIYVLNPKATSEETLLMPREITVHHPEAPAKDAVTALLEARHSPLASGVSLRGISVDSSVATLDFSQSPIKAGGEGAQSAGLNALAMTLGQFPEISTYQIKVQGQDVKTFGEFTADSPMDVVRPSAPLEAKGSQ